MRSHFYDLDALTYGFAPANLIVIASRPGVGKSSFALTIAENVAKYGNKSVVFFSLTKSRSKLLTQLIAQESDIEISKIANSVTKQQNEKLIKAIALYKSLPLFIDDTQNITVEGIRAEVLNLQRSYQQKELGLIVVDSLQLIQENTCTNRTEQLSKIVRHLKILAREFNIPILMLSEIDCSVDNRMNKRPRLTDISDCGSIEDIADLVLMIYRENYYDCFVAEREIAELIVVKHRNGATATIQLLYECDFKRFRNIRR